jgi:hypothetical protein
MHRNGRKNDLRKGAMKLLFKWDEVNARENLRKHKVAFEEGKNDFQ